MSSEVQTTIGRRVRGVLGMALTWGLAWVPISVALLPAVFGTWQVWTIDSRAVTGMAMEGFIAGALNGAVFGIVLTAFERRRRLGDLKLSRVAAYGALAGGAIAAMVMGIASLALPSAIVSPLLAIELSLFAGLGAASASASVALARRGAVIDGVGDLGRLTAAGE